MTLYEIVKIIHVSAISLSILGFITRFVMKLNDSPYQDRYWFKKLPHKVDTILLVTALIMVYLLGANPFTTVWIAEKLIGLLSYILLGMIALRWGKTRKIRIAAAIAAVLVFFYIIFVAHYKDPFVVFSYG